MKLNKIMRGAVLTAVHEDMMARETRRKNIIISDLPLAHGISDTALVDDLIESEFGFRPLIARTRRLGRPIDGRIQPIAVTLSAINDAIYLVDNAKMLRKSANDNARQFIYINNDMTKAEAQAAFDQRNQRRNERRTGVNHPPAAQSTARAASS